MLGALSQCYRTCIWQNARLAVNRVVPAAISTRAYSVPSTPPPPSPQFSGEQWGMITAQFSKGVNKSILSRDPEVVWSERETHQVASLNRPLDAYAGRSVAVHKDLGSAFVALQRILRRNSVTYELRRSERHEKKGVKRRRLRSERWRKRFAHEVRKKVQLVNEIRARGA